MTLLGKAVFAPVLFASLSLLAAHPAHAQNLVKDGGFESADPNAPADSFDVGFDSNDPFDASWTVSAGVAGIDTTDFAVYDGNKSLALTTGDPGETTTVQQTLSTTPGTSYTLSFYADDDSSSPLTVMFGGAAVTPTPIVVPQNGYPDPNSNAGEFTFFNYTVTAQSAFSVISFSAPNNNLDDNQQINGLELDDISVSSPVPEASTFLSLGLMLGLGGVAVAFRKKRAASAA